MGSELQMYKKIEKAASNIFRNSFLFVVESELFCFFFLNFLHYYFSSVVHFTV
jgi:hypothetical protein